SRMDAFARAVFGGPLSTKTKEKNDGAEQSLKANPTRQPVATTTTRSSLSAPPSARPTGIERLLTEAADIGISVDDDREGPTGRIWVNVTSAPDSRYRRLIRK